MGVLPRCTVEVRQRSRFSRLAQLVRDHPLLAVASALGSLGTFAAGTAAFAGLFGAGQSAAIGEAIRPDELGLPRELPYTYTQVADNSGQLSVEVPIGWDRGREWADGWHARDLDPVPQDKLIGPGLNAAPDVNAWAEDLETPGVFIGASRDLLSTHTPGRILDQIFFRRECTLWARETYTKGPFAGEILTRNCPTAQWRVLAAVRMEEPRYLVYVQVKLVTTADVEAYNRILETFEFDADD